jgi:hypothetical protein
MTIERDAQVALLNE